MSVHWSVAWCQLYRYLTEITNCFRDGRVWEHQWYTFYLFIDLREAVWYSNGWHCNHSLKYCKSNNGISMQWLNEIILTIVWISGKQGFRSPLIPINQLTGRAFITNTDVINCLKCRLQLFASFMYKLSSYITI